MRSGRSRKMGRLRESTMDSGAGAVKAEQKQAGPIGSEDLWKDTVWGTRDSFIKDRIELEGFSSEAAEKFAVIWETAERRLKENPPTDVFTND